MNPRYFFSRKPAQAEGGVYKIFDRTLDLRIASCDFKENAELITSALNTVLRLEEQKKRLETALEVLRLGPPAHLDNSEVASWAANIAQKALNIS